MGVPRLKLKLPVQDYLEGEKVTEIRHEYIDGEVFAMAGTSKRHDDIWFKLARKIADHLDGGPCKPHSHEIKVQIQKLNRYYYPDLAVVCTEDDESDYYITKPTLIVEILSPSTAGIDRREKMFAYQTIDSLQEYLMIDSETEFAELYRRRDDGLWSWITYDPGEDIELDSIKFKTPMSDLYK